MSPIYLVPSFHYDAAYLKTYREYLVICFEILDEMLLLLEKHPEYKFLAEQTILLEAYCAARPEKIAPMRRFAQQGRLEIGPGMYVMPDMNHPSGESLFLQARIGRRWLKETLGVSPRVCWIADCWGHPPSLPQILKQMGFDYYVFWRCMSRELLQADFRWQGIDGSTINTHWLARGYGNMRFPTEAELLNAADQQISGAERQQIVRIHDTLRQYALKESPTLICNGGDFMYPQATAPGVLKQLDLPIRFATPSDFLDAVPWEKAPVYAGEFNSALQGTFTTNIRIKQANRRQTAQMIGVEAIAALTGRPIDAERLWKPVLKQQFHDILCGTITDDAVRDWEGQVRQSDEAIDATLNGTGHFFNPLSFERTECSTGHGQEARATRARITVAALSSEATITPLPPLQPVTLPATFKGDHFTAEIDARGFIAGLTFAGRQLVRPHRAPFGGVTMQMDYCDSWLNFESPLSGGSVESSLDQNHPDPFDRMPPEHIVNSMTFTPQVQSAVARGNDEELIIEQTGKMTFWRLGVSFTTTLRLDRRSRRIDFRTTIQPAGKHYRLRVAFPTSLAQGTRRDEIPFGHLQRRQGEHVCQHWFDWSDDETGLAVLNTGTPAANVHDGVMLMTLFRSVAMEYKTQSTLSFNEGVQHTFDYAIVPHAGHDLLPVIQHGQQLNHPLIPSGQVIPSGVTIEPGNVMLSAIRPSGDGVFVRVYECLGQAASGRLTLPPRFKSYALADGLEQPTGDWRSCEQGVPLKLRPWEVKGLLVK